MNKPDPVEVVIEVLAVGENDVLGKGGPFNISKLFCIRGVYFVNNVLPSSVQFLE